MKISKKIIPSAITASLLLSLTACGGGGGGDSAPAASGSSSVNISGTAADGYIDGGTACLDLSLDGLCQSASEPTTTTDGSGLFSLNVTAAHQANPNFSTAPVIVYGGIDIDTQKAFIGTMKAPYKNANDIIVSPLSTMVKAIIDSGKTEEEATTAVATALGLNIDDVLKDPVTTPAITKAALSVQKSVELLAASNGGDDTSTIYTQLAPSVVAVSDANTSTGMGAIATEASNANTLTGSAALTAANGTVTLIENAVNDATTGTPAEQALVIDSQVNAAKTAVESDPSADVTNDIANAETNTRVLTISNILAQTSATEAQKTTILALQDLVDLRDGTATITKSAIATIIVDSADETLFSLATQLDSTVTQTILYQDITEDTTLTSDKVWEITGLIKVRPGATLTVEAGTTVVGSEGDFITVMKGAKIIADGTAANPIIFTSKVAHNGGTAEDGQWGGLTILGNAPTNQSDPHYEVDEQDADFAFGGNVADDNSGILRYVKVLNSGSIIGTDIEINGLSLCGVGTGTIVDNIEVINSSDDGVEVWGGTVNMSNLRIENALDDSLDLDFGYSGTVDGVEIVQTGAAHAGFEISSGGENPMTMATIKNFTITKVSGSDEGGIYIKDDTTAPTFINGTVTTVGSDAALNVKLAMTTAQKAAMAFGNVTLVNDTNALYDGTGAADGQAEVEANEGL